MNGIHLPVGLGMPGGWEIIGILLLVLVLFGSKRLPDLARSLGKGITEFKKAMNDANRELEKVTKEVQDAATTEPTPPIDSPQPKPTTPAERPPPGPV